MKINMKNKRTKRQGNKHLWLVTCIAVGVLMVGVVVAKILLTLSDSGVLGTTTVSVTVVCDGVCTQIEDELIDVDTGQPITPDSNGEYNVTNPNIAVDTTVRGTQQLVVTITNSSFPAPSGMELLNRIFASTDPEFGGTGGTIEVLPNGGLEQYIRLGRNVLDFYITSSINPSQDAHLQIVINYTLDRKSTRLNSSHT